MAIPTRRVYALLEFDANGGSGAPSAISRSADVTETQSYTIYLSIPQTIPTRENYDFLGWDNNRTSEQATKQPGDSYAFYFYPSSEDQSMSAILYAIWRLKQYSVSYNANGGSGAPEAQTKYHGVDLTLSSTIPVRENYIFQGWSTTPNGAVEYAAGGLYTANVAVVLYAVWKVAAATLNSVSDVDIGTSGTATWTKVDNNHTYMLALSMYNAPDVIIDNIPAGSQSCNFTIPVSWYNALPSSVSGIATATLYTFLNGSLVGYTSLTFNVSVNVSVVPVISAFTATPHSGNQTVENWRVVVQGYSYITLAVSAVAGTGASILSIVLSGHGINQTSLDTSGNTAIVTDIGTLVYSAVVTDSRGRVTQATVSIVSYEYANPDVSSLQAVRCLQDGTASDTEGNYIKALPIFSFSSVNGNNYLTVKNIEYKYHVLSNWTVATSSAVSDQWTLPFGVVDIGRTYDVRCVITDALNNTFVLAIIVPPVVGFAIGLKNDRARFGGPVEKAGLQVDWDAEFNGVVDITDRRSIADLTSPGWYRVCKYEDINSPDGIILKLFIGKANQYGTLGECHEITLYVCYGFHFNLESSMTSSAGSQDIDKIRCTGDDDNLYIDIHYRTYAQNVVKVDFVKCGTGDDKLFHSVSLNAVDDSPVGETVYETHEFIAYGVNFSAPVYMNGALIHQ